MVATASIEHSYWLAFAFVASVFVYATQAIAFKWKPGFRLCCVPALDTPDSQLKTLYIIRQSIRITTLGDRVLPVSAAPVWNALDLDVGLPGVSTGAENAMVIKASFCDDQMT